MAEVSKWAASFCPRPTAGGTSVGRLVYLWICGITYEGRRFENVLAVVWITQR